MLGLGVGRGAAAAVKFGWRIVEAEEAVTVRWEVGRRLAWLGMLRAVFEGSRTGGGRMPSRGEGESSTGELGISTGEMRRVGEA